MHAGADGGEHDNIARGNAMARKLLLDDGVEQDGNSGNRIVTHIIYIDGQHALRKGILPVGVEELAGDHFDHLLIGLVDEHLLDLTQADAAGTQAFVDQGRDLFQGVAENVTTVHFEIQPFGFFGRVVGVIHREVEEFFPAVGNGGMVEDTPVFSGLGSFQDDGAGAVTEEHAVAVVRVDDAAHGITADDQNAAGISGTNETVGLDDAL